MTFAAAATQIVPGATSFAIRNNANGANNLLIVDAGAATFRTTATFTGGAIFLGANAAQNGAVNMVNLGQVMGRNAANGADRSIAFISAADLCSLGDATALVNYNYASTALGGGAAPTVGTIGGSGPATAGQNCWLKVHINGTASYVPIWR